MWTTAPEGYLSELRRERVLCPEKRTTDKSLMFNRIREGSDLLGALVAIDFLGTTRFLPSFSGC